MKIKSFSDFDEACKTITRSLQRLSEWKHIYFGAAYSSRLEQLLGDLKLLVADVEETITTDKEFLRST